MHYSMIMENKSKEQRDQLDRVLNGSDQVSSAATAIDAVNEAILAGGDIDALFEEFG